MIKQFVVAQIIINEQNSLYCNYFINYLVIKLKSENSNLLIKDSHQNRYMMGEYSIISETNWLYFKLVNLMSISTH